MPISRADGYYSHRKLQILSAATLPNHTNATNLAVTESGQRAFHCFISEASSLEEYEIDLTDCQSIIPA